MYMQTSVESIFFKSQLCTANSKVNYVTVKPILKSTGLSRSLPDTSLLVKSLLLLQKVVSLHRSVHFSTPLSGKREPLSKFSEKKFYHWRIYKAYMYMFL
jgi:hypothetical protein